MKTLIICLLLGIAGWVLHSVYQDTVNFRAQLQHSAKEADDVR